MNTNANTNVDMDEQFLEMINASNLAFDVIIKEHTVYYLNAFSQACEDILDEATETVMFIEQEASTIEDLAGIKFSPLLSRSSLSEIRQTVITRTFLKRKAQEMAKECIKKNKKTRK